MVGGELEAFVKTGRHSFSHYYILLVRILVIQALKVNVKGISLFLEFFLIEQVVILVRILDCRYTGALRCSSSWRNPRRTHIFIQLVEAGKVIDSGQNIFFVLVTDYRLVEAEYLLLVFDVKFKAGLNRDPSMPVFPERI